MAEHYGQYTQDGSRATNGHKAAVEQEITLYSDDIQDIISHKPVFFVRYGMGIFFLIIAGLLTSTFFIHYPDIIKASARINGVNAPKLLLSKINGKLARLPVANETMVSKGTVIAIFESTADPEQLLTLKTWIDKTEPSVIMSDLTMLQTHPLPMLTHLGEVQPAYLNFQNTLMQTLQVLENGFFQKKIASLHKDIAYLHQTESSIAKQKELLEQDYMLQKNEYEMNERLAREGVIAPIDFNREKAKLLAKAQSMEQVNTMLINNTILVHSKHQALSDAEKAIVDQKQSFQSAFLTLKSTLLEWIQRFMVIAPEDGRVQYVSFLEENQMLSVGQELFYLVPHEGQFFAEVAASQDNFGKVKLNQEVIIKLAGYPYPEFGALKGRVGYIPNVPLGDGMFLIRVDLPQGLTTTYHKTLLYKSNLVGQAEIITDNQRLSDKLIYRFYKMLER
jgi:multidrug efflux pump subunit AcrA (membrane-fusion protein)